MRRLTVTVVSVAASADEMGGGGKSGRSNLSVTNLETKEEIRVPSGESLMGAFSPTEPLLAIEFMKHRWVNEPRALWNLMPGRSCEIKLGAFFTVCPFRLTAVRWRLLISDVKRDFAVAGG